MSPPNNELNKNRLTNYLQDGADLIDNHSDNEDDIPYPFHLPLPPDDQISAASGMTLPHIRRQLNIFCKEQLLEFAAYVMWSCPDGYKIGEAMLEADPSTRRVMVRGLWFSTTDETFQNYFSTFGDLENAAIIRRSDGRSQGYGFLIFRSRSAAELVVTQKHVLDDRPITTKLAADVRDRPPRGTIDQRKLFIRNIRGDIITREVLIEQFSVYGPIEECAIIPTAAGASKGYGFVTFKKARDALCAAQLPFRMIKNWIVFVTFSTGKGRRMPGCLFCEKSKLMRGTCPPPPPPSEYRRSPVSRMEIREAIHDSSQQYDPSALSSLQYSKAGFSGSNHKNRYTSRCGDNQSWVDAQQKFQIPKVTQTFQHQFDRGELSFDATHNFSPTKQQGDYSIRPPNENTSDNIYLPSLENWNCERPALASRSSGSTMASESNSCSERLHPKSTSNNDLPSLDFLNVYLKGSPLLFSEDF